MYAVSDEYISSMAADLREMPSFSVMLYNADNNANAYLSFSFDPEPLQRGEQLNSFNKVSARIPRATLEHNWLKANGRYSTRDTGDYIGACLSNKTPNDEGLYDYSAPDKITVNISSGSSKPLSFLLDEAISKVEITHTDGTVEIVSLFQNESGNILPVQDDGQGDVILRFLSSFYPLRRPRVYGIYAAQVFFWDCNDIVGVELEDENDLACLELPSRKVKLSINNLDRKMDPYKENINPSFRRKDTQAFLIFFYNNEPVPIGRLFLDAYTVDRNEITLSFDWAIMPLNDSRHSLSSAGYTANERLQELINPDPQYFVRTIRDVEQDTAAVYRITTNSDLIMSTIANIEVWNPYPICSRAECFQLLCNALGLLMRPGRQEDVDFLLPAQREVDRNITYDELLAEPEYTSQDIVSGATISCYDLSEEETIKLDSVISRSDEKTRIELDEPAVPSSGRIQDIYDTDGSYIGLVEYAAQGFAAYVWNAMESSSQEWIQESGEITISVQKRKKSTVEFGEAPRKRIDNPLIDTSLLHSFWQNISPKLARNAMVEIKHRGFPELDTGDLIRVQLRADNEFVLGQILQNKWEFKQGVLSGSTKLLLFKEVG